MVKIPTKILLFIYLIIPLCFLIVSADIFLLNGLLKGTLRANPESYRIVTIFLFYPHVLMSLGTLLDREYLKSYKHELFSWKLIPYVGTLIIGALWNKEIFFILFSYLSSKHLMGQQMGIERLVAKNGDRKIRSALSYNVYIIIATVIYYRIAFSDSKLSLMLSNLGLDKRIIFSVILLIYLGLFLETLKNTYKTKNETLKKLLWGNCFLISSALCFLQNGYIFFAFLAPRFIHDITAICFYTSHDKNRNEDLSHNLLSKVFNRIFKRTPIFAFPLFFIIFSNILTQYGNVAVEMILFCCGVFHFYVEGFMWKEGTAHRQYVALS